MTHEFNAVYYRETRSKIGVNSQYPASEMCAPRRHQKRSYTIRPVSPLTAAVSYHPWTNKMSQLQYSI